MRRIDYALGILRLLTGGGRQPIRSMMIVLVIADHSEDWIGSPELYDKVGGAPNFGSALERAREAGLIRTRDHPRDGRSKLYALTPEGAARARAILEAGNQGAVQ